MTTATQLGYMRLQDILTAPFGSGQLSVGLLTKKWRRTDPAPHCLREVRIQGSNDALFVDLTGTGPLVPSTSSVARASALFAANPGSGDAMGFFAEFDFGHMVSRFQGNVNLGLLVLAAFHDFKDGSARSNFFSREFFYSTEDSDSEPPPEKADKAIRRQQLDTSSLQGVWRNTNANSSGIVTIEIRDRGQELGIRAHGVGEAGRVDWGEVQGRSYGKDCFSAEAMAFSATFSSRGIRCHLQANVKQGVLVVAYFTEFQDGSGRSNYFSREFYYKEA